MIDDGEMGKSTWITYLYERIGGLEAPARRRGQHPAAEPRPAAFPGVYAEHDALAGARWRTWRTPATAPSPRRATEASGFCTGPITYDRAARRPRHRATSRRALRASRSTDAFLPVVAPASVYWLDNEYYGTEEEFVFAVADALHEEYRRDRRGRPAGPGRRRGAGARVRLDPLARRLRRRLSPLGASSASTRSTTRCTGSPRTASATTSAWAAGTGRTPSTRRSPT